MKAPLFGDRLDRAFLAFGWLVVVAGLLISPRPVHISPFQDAVGAPADFRPTLSQTATLNGNFSLSFSALPGPEVGRTLIELRVTGIRPRKVAHRIDFLLTVVTTAAVDRGAPVHILAGLAEDESGWRPGAVGKHGEVGLFQLKQPVADWCGIKDRRNPRQSADCAARYLVAQFNRFGTWEMAVVAFKAGPQSIPDNIPASSWAFAQRALLKAEAYR